MNREQDRHRFSLRTSVLRAGALLVLACGLLAGPAWAQHFEPMEFYHYDALGSVRLVVSFPHDSGTYTISRHDYLPFGEEIQPGMFGRARSAGYGNGDTTPQRFTGKERDPESNLDYFEARYYSGAMGRFSSVDPENAGAYADNPQTWNGYGYPYNSPLVYTDPTGLDGTNCQKTGDNRAPVTCAESEVVHVVAVQPHPLPQFSDWLEQRQIRQMVEEQRMKQQHPYLSFFLRAVKEGSRYSSLAAGGAPPRITPGSLALSEEEAVLDTLEHIDAGTRPFGALRKKWGTGFRNVRGDLPGTPGAGGYREYRVAPPIGTTGAGVRRIVVGQDGSVYYSWTHYGDTGAPAFVRLR
jgi:RHS repeat-associated protein